MYARACAHSGTMCTKTFTTAVRKDMYQRIRVPRICPPKFLGPQGFPCSQLPRTASLSSTTVKFFYRGHLCSHLTRTPFSYQDLLFSLDHLLPPRPPLTQSPIRNFPWKSNPQYWPQLQTHHHPPGYFSSPNDKQKRVRTSDFSLDALIACLISPPARTTLWLLEVEGVVDPPTSET